MTTQILGIDVGGSGIKGALVDLTAGELTTERLRIDSPSDFTLSAVAKTIAQICRHFDHSDAVGVGFPAVVNPQNGVVITPPTAHHYPGWVGHSAADAFSLASGADFVVVNDADAAGLAEARFGAGRGVQGTVVVLTLGTGVGSGLFYNGKLIPNTEFGKLYLKGHRDVSEQYMAGRIRDEEGLEWSEYGQRLNEYLQHVEWLMSPELIIIGGGISKKFEKYAEFLHLRTRVVPAELQNEAGIIGAAVAAVMGDA